MPARGPYRPAPPSAPSARLGLAILLAAFALLAALRLNETPIGSLTDDAYYVAMARSLAAGHGPVVQPGPDVPAANPGLFPPGFPLLLAPLAALRPDDLTLLKLVPLLGAVALLGLGWRLTRHQDAALRLAALAGVALNPWLLAWTGRITSDLPYAALALGALLVARPLAGGHAPRPGRWVAAIALTGAALLVRSVGLSVLLAILLVLAARRRWLRAGVVLAGVALTQTVLLVPGWSAGTPWLGDGYRTQLLGHHEGLLPRAGFLLHNLVGYLGELATLLLPVFGGPLDARLGPGAAGALRMVAALLLLALVAVGAHRTRRDARDDDALPALLLGYLGCTLLALANFDGWPSGVQTRLLLPLLPVLWWWAVAGAPAGRARTALVVACCAACLGHNVWRLEQPLEEASVRAGRGFVDPGDGAAWLRAHLGPGEVVAAPEPLVRQVRLGRPVIGLGEATAPGTSLAPDLAALEARAARYGARWLWLGPSVHGSPRQLDEAGARWQAALAAAGRAPVWSDPALAVSVYRLGEPPRQAASPATPFRSPRTGRSSPAR